MSKSRQLIEFLWRQPLWRKAAAAAALLFVCLWFGRGKAIGTATTFAARRGPLVINVTEGGTIEAQESQDVKCEVKGYQGTKILKIIEEGYQVTENDVKEEKVLVELDSSEIRKQITQADMQFQSTSASLIEAQQGYEIQLNQNASDIKAAEQKARFARMDFEKFMGAKAAQEIIVQLGLERIAPGTNGAGQTASSASASSATVNRQTGEGTVNTNSAADGKSGHDTEFGGGVDAGPRIAAVPIVPPPSPPQRAEGNPGGDPKTSAAGPEPETTIDFSRYARLEALGDGEAKQKIRKFDDDLQVAQREHSQQKSTLEGTRRLHAKGFATKTELESDEIKLENVRLKVQTAETARALFLNYEFLKSAEEFLSKFLEAARELDRARKAAVSKLAQAESKLKAAEARYNLEMRQRKDLQDQLDKCYIKAKKPGFVVYGGGNMNMYYYGQEQIREGATVREQQPIITIPNLSRMAAKVKIHESYIKKVRKGQRARITLDAFPDKGLEGEVTKVGVLPDSQNRWMNPDLKVYLTTISVEGTNEWLKPGMSAKVEILVHELPEVIYVPIQAVTPMNDKHWCYVVRGGSQERREVEIGEFNDDFIEIKKGLKAGEKVSLRAPEVPEKEDGGKEQRPSGSDKKKDGRQPTPAPAKA